MELARRWLGDLRRGVEIGASALNPFPGVRAWNLDQKDSDVWRRAQERQGRSAARIDVHADAGRLPVADGALDFVLASHVVEHMPDTLRALREWDRAVRAGGILFLIVPHPERTFDRGRPRTPVEHHLADFAEGITAATDPMIPTSHYHVWRAEDFVELVRRLDAAGFLAWDLVAIEDPDSKAGNGFTVVVRKRAAPAGPPVRGPGRTAFHRLTLAVPFQVVGRSLDVIVLGERLVLPPALDRGLYRAVPFDDGIPPFAGAAFEVLAGDPVPPPVLESHEYRGGQLLLRGRHLTRTTWIEFRHPAGLTARLLPGFGPEGLEIDLAGVVLPDVAVQAVAINLPPGGGEGPPLAIPPRTDA